MPVADMEYMPRRKHSIIVSALTALFEHKENTTITKDDPFDVIGDLAAVRGGRCEGACCLEEILRRSADAGAAAGTGPVPRRPPRSGRRAWPAGLEADLAAAAEMRQSTSTDGSALPTESAGVHSASGGSVDCPRVGIP
jgi:hypothetical protein